MKQLLFLFLFINFSQLIRCQDTTGRDSIGATVVISGLGVSTFDPFSDTPLADSLKMFCMENDRHFDFLKRAVQHPVDSNLFQSKSYGQYPFTNTRAIQKYSGCIDADFSRKIAFVATNLKAIVFGWKTQIGKEEREYYLTDKYLKLSICHYVLDNHIFNDCEYLKYKFEKDRIEKLSKTKKYELELETHLAELFKLVRVRVVSVIESGEIEECERNNLIRLLENMNE